MGWNDRDPHKPWIIVEFNLTTKRVRDMSRFENPEHALKWLEFVVTHTAESIINKEENKVEYINKNNHVMIVEMVNYF